MNKYLYSIDAMERALARMHEAAEKLQKLTVEPILPTSIEKEFVVVAPKLNFVHPDNGSVN